MQILMPLLYFSSLGGAMRARQTRVVPYQAPIGLIAAHCGMD
jgi:hypothetical protein